MKKNMNKNMNVVINANASRRPSARMHCIERLEGQLINPEVTATFGGFTVSLDINVKNPENIRVNITSEAAKVTSSVEGLRACQEISEKADKHNLEHAIEAAKAFGSLLKQGIHEGITLAEDETPRIMNLMRQTWRYDKEIHDNNRAKHDRRRKESLEDYRKTAQDRQERQSIDAEFEDVK